MGMVAEQTPGANRTAGAGYTGANRSQSEPAGAHQSQPEPIGANRSRPKRPVTSPEKSGDSFWNSLLGPRLEYCPMVSSKQKSGRPATSSMITYGIRKAPAADADSAGQNGGFHTVRHT